MEPVPAGTLPVEAPANVEPAPSAAPVDPAPVGAGPEPAPAAAVASDAAGVQAEPVAAVPALTTATAEPPARIYPSLYDQTSTTIVAVLLGAGIIAGVQFVVHRIYATAKSPHDALTQFATKMVALIIAVFLADVLLAGPDTSLLSDQDHTQIIDFVRQTVLMVFSFFFGRSTATASEPPAPSTPTE